MTDKEIEQIESERVLNRFLQKLSSFLDRAVEAPAKETLSEDLRRALDALEEKLAAAGIHYSQMEPEIRNCVLLAKRDGYVSGTKACLEILEKMAKGEEDE